MTEHTVQVTPYRKLKVSGRRDAGRKFVRIEVWTGSPFEAFSFRSAMSVHPDSVPALIEAMTAVADELARPAPRTIPPTGGSWR